MDTYLVKDILPLIFSRLVHDTSLHLVCKFWNQIYKYAISIKNIKVRYVKASNGVVNVFHLDVSKSDIQDFSNFSNMVYLKANACDMLDDLSLFSSNFEKLTELNISNCINITKLPNCKNLEKLNMANCMKITDIKLLKHMKYLRFLNISGCGYITEVPNLINLKILYARLCNNLVNIKCINLTMLYIRHTVSLTSLPNCKLKKLDIHNCFSINNMNILENMDGLKKLTINGYDKDFTISKLQNIEALYIKNCKGNITICENADKLKILHMLDSGKITKLPISLKNLVNLYMSFCFGINNIHVLKNANKLKYLDISFCGQITEVPEIKKLESLVMENCIYIMELPVCVKNLVHLNISNCINIHNTNIIKSCKQLKYLIINNCPQINKLYMSIQNLKELSITNCININNIHILENAKELKKLNISGCNQITTLPKLENIISLTAKMCQNLINVNGVGKKLTKLSINYCNSINELPANIENLVTLSMIYCTKIKNIEVLKNAKNLKHISIEGCETDLPDMIKLNTNIRIQN